MHVRRRGEEQRNRKLRCKQRTARDFSPFLFSRRRTGGGAGEPQPRVSAWERGFQQRGPRSRGDAPRSAQVTRGSQANFGEGGARLGRAPRGCKRDPAAAAPSPPPPPLPALGEQPRPGKHPPGCPPATPRPPRPRPSGGSTAGLRWAAGGRRGRTRGSDTAPPPPRGPHLPCERCLLALLGPRYFFRLVEDEEETYGAHSPPLPD